MVVLRNEKPKLGCVFLMVRISDDRITLYEANKD